MRDDASVFPCLDSTGIRAVRVEPDAPARPDAVTGAAGHPQRVATMSSVYPSGAKFSQFVATHPLPAR